MTERRRERQRLSTPIPREEPLENTSEAPEVSAFQNALRTVDSTSRRRLRKVSQQIKALHQEVSQRERKPS